uniref:NADP-dependent oxidoreductase domain-containing protein n=1 Tax=Timema shepardi TaxID=629360 RepID=A0A7R9AZB5_TIMSH|nr:unnamed protein product [Timema shepardi]
MTSFNLSSGQKIPAVGLGTWQSKPADVSKAVADALGAGYRHIDTAYNYFNEDAIGKALSHWLGVQGNSRQDLFISTKLPHVGNRPCDVRKYLDKSLARLRLDYIDLYMVHMPFGFFSDQSGDSPAVGKDGSYLLDINTDIVAVWKVMESLVDEGKARAIGVSNFNIDQLERLLAAARVPPAVNQVETHASCQQSELRAFCRRQDILVTAYSPLGSPGSRVHFKNKYNYSPETYPDHMNHPTVQNIARRHNKTPAQILLKHLVQQGVAVIPKSVNPARIAENIQIFDFELDVNELNQLNSLDQGEEGRIVDYNWYKGVEAHPEYPFTERLKRKMDKNGHVGSNTSFIAR